MNAPSNPASPRFRGITLIVAVLAACLAAPVLAQGDPVPLPEALAPALKRAATPDHTAAAFLSIPYRDDATVDESGRFTLFEHPETTLASPGLNCSGFVLSLSRFLLQKNITLAQAKKDRAGDSGPQSPHGRDWDFGLDLVLNIAEGLPVRAVLPDGASPDVTQATGRDLRGFPIADAAAWARVLPRLRPGFVYLASISKPVKKRGYTLLHYHVALILPAPDGTVSVYHATPGSGSHRVVISTPQGLAQFQSQFRDKVPGEKRILLLEAPLPR
ncbi:MAG: hypothetical protein GYA47_00610 [Desulfovibrio sp.]|nr:hypothetical protein [Desulfovibrio sp.]